MKDKYICITFPDIQDYFEFDWFADEAVFISKDDKRCFIPLARHYEAERKWTIENGKLNICPNCATDSLQKEAWVNMETQEYIDDIPHDEIWCNKCEEFVKTTLLEPFTAHGYLTLSNAGGVEIELNNNGDSARLLFTGDSIPTMWLMAHYGPDGSPYVNYNKKSYFIDDFIRTNF